ncbi:MAG: MFS transporter [Candidatus Heimdallarchaeota archaeon]
MDEKVTEDKTSFSTSALGVLFLAVFIDLLGFGIVLPLLPFWVSSIGGSAIIYGLLVSSYSLMQFIFSPFWGRLSDRRGRRPIILVGLTGTLISFILLSITALLFSESLLMLFLSRILGGIFTAATLPTSQAYITDTTTGDERAKGFGLIGAAFGLGFAIGPALGGFLSIWGYAAPALFSAVLAFINLIGGIIRLPESLDEKKREELMSLKITRKEASPNIFKIILSNPTIMLIILLFASISFVFSSLEATLALFGEARFGLDESLTGFVFLIVGIVAIITQGGILRPLSSRYADTLLIASGILALVIGFVGLSSVTDLLGMMIWVIPLAFGSSIANPALGASLSKNAPSDISGAVLGVNQGSGSLMRIFGPIVGAGLFEIQETLQWLLAAGILIICLILAVVLHRIAVKPVSLSVCLNCGNQLKAGIANCGNCGIQLEVS